MSWNDCVHGFSLLFVILDWIFIVVAVCVQLCLVIWSIGQICKQCDTVQKHFIILFMVAIFLFEAESMCRIYVNIQYVEYCHVVLISDEQLPAMIGSTLTMLLALMSLYTLFYLRLVAIFKHSMLELSKPVLYYFNLTCIIQLLLACAAWFIFPITGDLQDIASMFSYLTFLYVVNSVIILIYFLKKMQDLSDYIQSLNTSCSSLTSMSYSPASRPRVRTTSMSNVKINGGSSIPTTSNKAQTSTIPAAANNYNINKNIGTDHDQKVSIRDRKHTESSGTSGIRDAMADTMTLDIGTRMLICVFFALLSSLIISLLFQRVSVDRSHSMAMTFTISLVVDSIINSLCLILQWEFSDKLYYALCDRCDLCVKWYYLTRIFPRKTSSIEIKVHVLKKTTKTMNKPDTSSNKSRSNHLETDIQTKKKINSDKTRNKGTGWNCWTQ